MKRQRWALLEAVLGDFGFVRTFVEDENLRTAWFSCQPWGDDGLGTNFRFSFKSDLKVLTMHAGWNHSVVRQFVLRALEESWPSGLAWILEAGLLHTPSMLLFDLASQLRWQQAGMPAGGNDQDFARELVKLHTSGVFEKCALDTPQSLLQLYLKDLKPFDWQSSNSAIRAAEIAGLRFLLQENLDCFDSVATAQVDLIRADMFGLGSAEHWTKSLRGMASRNAALRDSQ